MTKRQRRIARARRRRRRRIIRILLLSACAAVVVLAVFGVRHLIRSINARNGKGDIIVMSTENTTGSSASGVSASAGGVNASASPGTEGTAQNAAAQAEGNAPQEAAAEAGSESSSSPYILTPTPTPDRVALTANQKSTGNLILVNAAHPFDFEANSEEQMLVSILSTQTYIYPVAREDFRVARRIMKSLDAMLHDCDQTMGTRETGIESAYRSLEDQERVYEEIRDEYGSDYAAEYVADPGTSEHHTGLAVDLGIFYDDGSYGTFSGSSNAEWMAENCWKYGFIRRYAEDKTQITGISNESWHFRYVGLPHSWYMKDKNLCLEEYVTFLRDGTSPEKPLRITYEGGEAEVYYTLENAIPKPTGRYDVSGDNCGGCIVTLYH